MNSILNNQTKLSEHFALGELVKSGSHPEVYNVPSHEVICNLKRLCKWLEALRERYNATVKTSPRLSCSGGVPVIISSGYRSPELNRKVGGVATSNHLTGCAADIRVKDMEQLIRYAAILLDYADETHQLFDELLIERNGRGSIWLHLAVRPKDNRRKIALIV